MSRKGGRRSRSGARKKWTRRVTRRVYRRSLHASGIDGTAGLSSIEVYAIYHREFGPKLLDAEGDEVL